MQIECLQWSLHRDASSMNDETHSYRVDTEKKLFVSHCSSLSSVLVSLLANCLLSSSLNRIIIITIKLSFSTHIHHHSSFHPVLWELLSTFAWVCWTVKGACVSFCPSLPLYSPSSTSVSLIFRWWLCRGTRIAMPARGRELRVLPPVLDVERTDPRIVRRLYARLLSPHSQVRQLGHVRP